MKLLIQNTKIVGTATDEYDGPEMFVLAPDDFTLSMLDTHQYIDGQVVLKIPTSVTMRQARLALLQVGLLASVDAAIDALPSPQKEAARIEWDYSNEVHRDQAFVQTLGTALGLDATGLDNLFITASTL